MLWDLLNYLSHVPVLLTSCNLVSSLHFKNMLCTKNLIQWDLLFWCSFHTCKKLVAFATNFLCIQKNIKFNKKATRWLGVRLNGQLKLSTHINERIRRACIAKIQIKSLTNTYALMYRLIRQIQLALVQSTAIYDAEL